MGSAQTTRELFQDFTRIDGLHGTVVGVLHHLFEGIHLRLTHGDGVFHDQPAHAF